MISTNKIVEIKTIYKNRPEMALFFIESVSRLNLALDKASENKMKAPKPKLRRYKRFLELCKTNPELVAAILNLRFLSLGYLCTYVDENHNMIEKIYKWMQK